MKFITFSFSILLATMATSTHAELPGVKLIVNGADPATGTIEATIFNSAESFLLEAHLQQSGDVAEDGSFEAEFIGLEEGEYAIVVIHDANDNGVYDAGLFGIGGEAIGYSNDASGWFGPPGFEDAKFVIDQADQTVTIVLD